MHSQKLNGKSLSLSIVFHAFTCEAQVQFLRGCSIGIWSWKQFRVECGPKIRLCLGAGPPELEGRVSSEWPRQYTVIH